MKIQKEITLHPSLLSKEYKSNIYNEIIRLYKNSCSKKYGYIIDVHENISIGHNYISSASNGIIFMVEFDVISIYPTIGMIINSSIYLINENGIFTTNNNVIKTIISSKNIGSYTYNKNLKCYSNGNANIYANTSIDIQIVSIRYSNNEFNCIGILIQ